MLLPLWLVPEVRLICTECQYSTYFGCTQTTTSKKQEPTDNKTKPVNRTMPIVEGSRVVVISGEYGVGRHGRVKWLCHAGPDNWQRGALVEMDGGWFPAIDTRERRDSDKVVWFPLHDLRLEDEDD